MKAPNTVCSPIASVAQADSSSPLKTTPWTSVLSRFQGRSGASSQRRPGRITYIMLRTKRADSTAIRASGQEPVAFTTTTTTASTAHASKSCRAALASATCPTRSRDRPWSERMRASTGKAVMDMAAPRNSAGPTSPVRSCSEKVQGASTRARPVPSANGRATELSETATTWRPWPRRSARSR